MNPDSDHCCRTGPGQRQCPGSRVQEATVDNRSKPYNLVTSGGGHVGSRKLDEWVPGSRAGLVVSEAAFCPFPEGC